MSEEALKDTPKSSGGAGQPIVAGLKSLASVPIKMPSSTKSAS